MANLAAIERRWSRAIVAAPGPSLTPAVAAACPGGWPVIAVNDAYRRFPGATVLYACDAAWWEVHGGAADFKGEKWSCHDAGGNDKSDAQARWGLNLVLGRHGVGFSTDPAVIHYGSNSGFQAINLAMLWGASAIVLVGFDMTRGHFFGNHPAPLVNNKDYARFIPEFEAAAARLPAGVRVLNATPGSALTCFPAVDLEDALQTLDMTLARQEEHAKYARAYAAPGYAMGAARKADACRDLAALPARGAYLDVGCGRGEMLSFAKSIGFDPVRGVEVVPGLIDGDRVVRGEVHALPLPDKSVDVATLFDVIEHLVPGDDARACAELARVARRHVLLTANNRPSHLPDGTDLHINKRPYEAWDRLFRAWFQDAAPGARVTWLKGGRSYVSEGWRVDL